MKSAFFETVLRHRRVVFTGLAMFAMMTSAHATELVTNGGFETTTGATSGQLGYNVEATGWVNGKDGSNTNGYNFLFNPGEADTTGAIGSDGTLKLWGPGGCPGNSACSNNGLPASSPTGGNYIAMDGAYETAAISQTINNLVVGDSYTVSFYWAGAQQGDPKFTAPTTEQMIVSFGSETQSTVILPNAGEGFTGWQQESFTFTADATSDVLSFLASGTPPGMPPFSLLDGVSVDGLSSQSPVPEPASIALLLTGFAGVGSVVRRRFKK